MSLQLAAQHLSHQGRFGDSTLVHMSPVEVAALQKLAEKHGMSLTINPETGLPEAFSLKKLLPMIAGFALGPAGFGIFSSAMGAGLAVGGVEALRTGDLGRGLMAGLGAYGGASLGAGLAGAGAGAAQQAAISGLGEGATQEAINQAAAEATKNYLGIEGATNPLGFMDRLGQGVSAAINKPSAFVEGMGGGKGLARAAYMAAVPSLMEQPKTTTSMPEINQYMRTFDVDPYGRARALTPYKLGTRPPGGKAGGLTAALANGGAVAFADGGQAGSAQRIQEWWEANQGKASPEELDKFLVRSGFSAKQISAALPQFSEADLTKAIAGATERVGTDDISAIRNWWESNQGKASEQDLQNFLATSGYSAAQINEALPQFKVSDLNKAMNVAVHEVNKQNADARREAYLNAQLGRPGPTTAPPEYRANVSAIPQSEIDEARKRMYERDPEVAAFLDWRRGQYGLLGTSNALLPEDPTFNPFDLSDQTFKEYKDMQEGAKKRGVAEWLDPNWREKQAQKRAETEAFWARQREADLKAGLVIGPGGSPPAPPPTSGPPVPPPPPPPGGPPTGPPGPIPPSPPPSGPPSTPPPGQPPYQPPVITGPGKPEDLMSGRSLEAYNALFGKGSTGTKVWQTSPMQAYYPERRGEYYIRRGDSTITTQSGSAPTTFTNPNQRPTVNPGPGMEWFWDTVNMMWKSRPVMTNTSPPGNIFTPDGGNFINQFAANGGIMRSYADGGALGGISSLGGYSDGGRLLRGPGDGVSDSIPATIADRRPARLADGEFVVPARIVSELGNGSTEAGARKLYAMMDRVQKARGKTTGRGRVAVNSRADKHLPA